MTPLDTLEIRPLYFTFSHDGKSLIHPTVTGPSYQLHFWEYGRGHDSVVNSAVIGQTRIIYDIETSADGRYIYLAGTFGITIVDMEMVNPAVNDTLRLWRTQQGVTSPGIAWDVDVDPTGRRIAAMDHDSGIAVWDLSTKERIWQGRPDSSYTYPIEWSGDGTRLLTGMYYRETGEFYIEEYNADDGQLIRYHDVTEFSGIAHAYYALGGEYIVAGCGDSTLRVWDAETFELVDEIRDHANYFTVDVSHDGRYVATLGQDSLLNLYEFNVSSVSEPVAGESVDVLHAPLPNPARDNVEIPYTLTKGGEVELSIVDLHGRVVVNRGVGYMPAGRHGTRIDLEGMPSGMYYAVMRVEGERLVKPMRIVR